MKLSVKIIIGFLLVSIVPLALISTLLFFFVDASYDNFYLQRSNLAYEAFQLHLDDQLHELESMALSLSAETDFIVGMLEDDNKQQRLTTLLEKYINRNDFQFALVLTDNNSRPFKAYQNNLRDLLDNYTIPQTYLNSDENISGLIRLQAGSNVNLAVVVIAPIFHNSKKIGVLLLGRTAENFISDFPVSLYGLTALIVHGNNKLVYARADESIADDLQNFVFSLDQQQKIQLEFKGESFLISANTISGLDNKEVAEIRFISTLSEFSESKNKLIKTFTLLAIGGLLFSLLAGFLFSRIITRPLVEMSTAARKIADGSSPERVHYFYNDEIGDLTDGINRLTTDLKETEIRLRQSEQIAGWQMFARQTAHEMKNYLMPLATHVGRLARKANDGIIDAATTLRIVEDIKGEILRIKYLTASFSEFAKLPTPEMKIVSVEKIITDIESVFVSEIKNSSLIISTSAGEVQLDIDPDQIRQALVNLIKNSYEAKASVVDLRIEKKDNSVIFEVTDDGQEINNKQDIDLFAPLYSTKEQGSGLGLAIVRRIILDHGGDINYYSNPTGGMVFKFNLPIKRK